MKIQELRDLLQGLPRDTEICVVDRNDNIQQTLEIIDVGYVNELGRYVIWSES